MDVSEAIRTRRAVRSYADRDVSEKTIQELFESVRLAPSARNDQSWRFVAVTENDRLGALYDASFEQRAVDEAPVVIAGISTTPTDTMRCGIETGPVDLAIALDHLSLRAVEMGLGTCWIGSFDQERVTELLDVPAEWQVIELMTLGYPDGELAPVEKDRKPLADIFGFETCPK
ncbi:nitroreductase family protein [Halorhabdus amylolytica]|uniref:nitroreductase family protein n=1 Tax=Halorhabdus amylolytica TaxID=2559573 RepID=UPI0010A9BEAE|nr:nitroreductase family protein [Halorhabdus amylolytica]